MLQLICESTIVELNRIMIVNKTLVLDLMLYTDLSDQAWKKSFRCLDNLFYSFHRIL